MKKNIYLTTCIKMLITFIIKYLLNVVNWSTLQEKNNVNNTATVVSITLWKM